MELYWYIAAIGALCMGFGIVLLFHANNLKNRRVKVMTWFIVGSLGLLFYIAGNSFMIDAAKNLML